MSVSIFAEKTIKPNEKMLSGVLKDKKVIWDKILSIAGGEGEWKFYSKAAGWSYSAKKGNRTLLYMIPMEDCIRLTFVYGIRAVEAAPSADLPTTILNDLSNATQHMEGRSVAVDVSNEKDLDTVQKMLQLKLEY